MMIEVTVKTLDSKNHSFTVSEELTVKEFKDEISTRVSIVAAEQRLIFRGRVLQDDKKIQEYNVANNTIHLVQRPNQPGGTSSQNDEPPRNTSGGNAEDRFNMEGGGGGIIITAGTSPTDRNAIFMGTIGIPTIDIPVGEQSLNATPTGGRRNSAAMRLQIGNEMINRASSLLQRLEEDDEISQVTSQIENAPNPNEQESEIHDISGLDVNSMEVDTDDPASLGRMISQVANAASAAAVLQSVRSMNSQGAPNSGNDNILGIDGQQLLQNAATNDNIPGTPSIPGSGPGSRRADAPRLREMAIALQDLLAFNERLTPFLQFAQRILRENQSYSTETGELRSVQYAFDTVSSIMHYLAHSYHAYSDLLCDFATTPDSRRLSAPATILVEQSTVVRATIPIAVPASFGTGSSSPFQQPSAPQQQQAQETASQNQTGNSSSTPPLNVPSSPSMQRSTFARNNSPLNPSGVNINSHNVAGNPGISINIQSNGIPDLASILGPAFAGVAGGAGGGAGMLPFLSLGGLQANLRQQQAQQRSQAQQNNSPGGQPHWTATAMGNNSSSRNNESAQQQSQQNSNSATANAVTGGNVSGIAGMGNFQQNLRNELIRPPLDILLNCHSHHSNRNRTRRPTDLHQHVNVARDDSSSVPTTRPHDFFESFVEIIRYSTWLETLQPHLKDIVQNYLMRGRDIKNSLHIKTCARSLAKKLQPFFQSITDTISTKNEKIAYQQTFSEFVTKFYFKLLSLVVNSGPTRQFRTSLLLLWEESMLKLFAMFRHCFPNNNRVPAIFAKAVVEEYFAGMPLVFRSYASDCLAEYCISFSSSAETKFKTPESVDLIFKTEEDSLDEGLSSSVTRKVASPFTSNNSLPATSHTQPTPIASSGSQPSTSTKVAETHSVAVDGGASSSSSLPPKKVTASDIESMETDIDDLVDRIPQGPRNDDPLIHLPPEWREAVRHDIHRQLGMPEQPPPSPGYFALFHRKH